MKILKAGVAAVALQALAGTAQATLTDRGGGLIYDSAQNLTWLADMNHAQTQYTASGGAQGDADGLMTWGAAKLWADNLVYGGYSDWRLPTLNPSDTSCSSSFNPGGGFGQQYFGTHCTGGELSHLFVTDLGHQTGESVLIQTGNTAEQRRNLALFSKVQSHDYWSGTENATNRDGAWYFHSFDNSQGLYDKGVAMYAVAVRPGDVTAAVPEPQAYALMLVGVGVVLLAWRRRPR
jgi:hypothetical protein